jgi:SAM-dependent methyltransferase
LLQAAPLWSRSNAAPRQRTADEDGPVPDAIFADWRLAELYDVVDDDRSDLDAYVAIVAELGASSVLDVGCGTGTLACRLGLGGSEVVALDPAQASLDVARRKSGADCVRWVHGTMPDLPALEVDLAVMTGNVAQVFVTDGEWRRTLAAAHDALRPRGWLVFETRNPARRAWEGWTRELTYRELETRDAGRVATWTDLADVDFPLVSFRQVFRFQRDGVEVVSDSTLRFRGRDEITRWLTQTGFVVQDVRDAPDRPGLEFVFLAQRC